MSNKTYISNDQTDYDIFEREKSISVEKSRGIAKYKRLHREKWNRSVAVQIKQDQQNKQNKQKPVQVQKSEENEENEENQEHQNRISRRHIHLHGDAVCLYKQNNVVRTSKRRENGKNNGLSNTSDMKINKNIIIQFDGEN